MSPRVKARPAQKRPRNSTNSLKEFRAVGGDQLDRMSVDDAIQSVVRSPSKDRAFWRYMTAPRGVTGNPLDMLDQHEHRVLSKASGAAGGYLVPLDLYEQIIEVRRQRSTIGVLARQIVTSTGTTINVATATAHGTSTWTAENAGITASDETFGQVAVGAYKAATLTLVSEELLADDGTELDAYLAGELGLRLAVLEDAAYAVGDGTGKPMGIANASSGYTVATAAVGSTLVFKAADVATAYAALSVAYVPTATWLFAPSAFRSLAGLADTAGGLVYPTLHAAEPTLYARPVVVAADMPTSAANARSAFFGDLEQAYAVRRVAEVGVQRLDELYAGNGQVGYRAIARVDGRPTLLEAGIILRHSAT